jgi:hypothetical protein
MRAAGGEQGEGRGEVPMISMSVTAWLRQSERPVVRFWDAATSVC